MWTTDDNHGAQVQFHSGGMLDGRHPTIGAWITYGLGSLNENLPQFVTMGPRFFDTDGHYLGPAYDAVPLNLDRDQPLDYAQPEHSLSSTRQRDDFASPIASINFAGAFPQDDRLRSTRIQSYELAFRMQRSVPTLLDLDRNVIHSQSLRTGKRHHAAFRQTIDCRSTHGGKGRPIHSDHARGWCGWRMGCAQWPQGKP